jgi:hypothetical protein
LQFGLNAGLIGLYRKRQSTISKHQQTIIALLAVSFFPLAINSGHPDNDSGNRNKKRRVSKVLSINAIHADEPSVQCGQIRSGSYLWS